MTTTVVTGAASGIGLGCATRLVARGDHVVCADIDAGAVARAVATLGPGCTGVTADVSSAADCERVAQAAVDAGGGVDNLVISAGILRGAVPAHRVEDADFEAVIGVNLTGAFYTARAAARRMIEAGNGGRIVFIGSMASTLARPERAAYCASKGGIAMMARALAVDWAPHGILVNVVSPGIIRTPLSAHLDAQGTTALAGLVDQVPLGTAGEVADVAGAVAWLTDPETRYVTGSEVVVDGGWTISTR